MADIRFFQAAATAFPTLFIAIGVSGKFLSREELNRTLLFDLDSKFDRYALIGSISLFSCAELVSLGVLVSNRPSTWAAVFIATAISLFILYVCFSITSYLVLSPDGYAGNARILIVIFLYGALPLILFLLYVIL